MRLPAAIAIALAPLAALALAGPASAQPGGYAGTGYPGSGYAGGYGGQPGYDDADGPYGDAGAGYRSGWSDQRRLPAYEDDERWGASQFYGTAEARDDDDLDLQAARTRPAVPPSRYGDERSLTAALNAREADRAAAGGSRYGDGAGVQSPRTAAYADRVARWRARADACEAGNMAACRGAE